MISQKPFLRFVFLYWIFFAGIASQTIAQIPEEITMSIFNPPCDRFDPNKPVETDPVNLCGTGSVRINLTNYSEIQGYKLIRIGTNPEEVIESNHPNYKQLLENFKANPKLVAVYKKADDVGLDEAKLNTLMDDLFAAGNEKFLQTLIEKAELVNAWRILHQARNNGGVRKASEVLGVLNRIIDNHDLVSSIGGEDKLIQILKSYAGPCSTCKDGVAEIVTSLRPVDEMLVNLEYFGKRFSHIRGAQNVIDALGSVPKNQHSPSFIMDIMAREGYNPEDVAAFELTIDGFRADVDLIDKLIEVKSWVWTSIKNYPTFPINDQLLRYIEQLPQAEYWFDFNRLRDNFSSTADAELAIKEVFQDWFSRGNNSLIVFRKNESFFRNVMWKGSGIDSHSKFQDLLKNDKDFINSEIFDFIKAK